MYKGTADFPSWLIWSVCVTLLIEVISAEADCTFTDSEWLSNFKVDPIELPASVTVTFLA